MDYSQIAELYDVYVQTDLDVAFFLQEAQGRCKVLELTSGTGRLSVPLLRAGVPLSCLDSSPEMLAVLRRKLQAQGLTAPVYALDATDFRLPQQFDLILFPFNSFSEITRPEAQRACLAAIRSHLSDGGRFICILHNPAVRLKSVDGQLHVRSRLALPGGGGSLFFSSVEHYDAGAALVRGAQFYEIYAPDGCMQAKRFVDLQFSVHTREGFETLAGALGWRVEALYGDYQRAAFDAEKSPFMIWALSKSS